MDSALNKMIRECMFSGEPADSDEHVIPSWLQRRFGLWGQDVVLPNQTAFRYARAKVGVKAEHNQKFGLIENRMAEGRFNLQEAYLWGLKIHVGMMWLDSRLKRERKDQSSGTILNTANFSKQLLLFRHLYKNWANGGTTLPYPFGSVFLLEGALMPGEFDFIHCMISGAVGISIDDRFLVVLLWDLAEGMRGRALRDWDREHRSRIQNSPEVDRPRMSYMARHVWMCEVAHELLLWRRPFRFREWSKISTAMPSVAPRVRGAVDREALIKICRSFALKPIFTEGDLPNHYMLEFPDLPHRIGVKQE